jgi:hypothetical protein
MWQAAPESCGDVDPMPDYENVMTGCEASFGRPVGGFCRAVGFSRVGQGRPGFAAAQFPPAPPARAATVRQRDPEAGERREKLGKICLLTPSARSGRMGAQ